MYKHHQQAIENLKTYFSQEPGVLGVILGGSVAKGLERSDSDIDAMVVVTPERYQELKEQKRTVENIFGYCGYEEGYFDVKYMTKDYLAAAADHGSEPTRNSFLCSRCVLANDPEIPGLVERIPVFQTQEKEEKQAAFYAILALNKDYFWEYIETDPLLKARTVSDIAFFGLRMFMQDREVLFPCAKSMYTYIRRMENVPEGLLESCTAFVEDPTNETMQRFVDLVMNSIAYRPPEDYSLILSRYTADTEQWWYKARPFIAEW